MRRVTHHQRESMGTDPALYMALELGVAQWHLAIGTTLQGRVRHRRLTVTSSQAMSSLLREEIARAKAMFGLPPAAAVRSCYEAGRDGFWVHRLLLTLGVDNRVVDSASIEVNRRARQAKTDRLDAAKLLRMLLRYWGGEHELWQVVRAPGVAEEDARHAARLRVMLTKERTRWRNRIHAALMLHGVRLAITARFLEQLPTVRDWSGTSLPPGAVALVTQYWRQLQQVQAMLREVRRVLRAPLRDATTPTTRWAARVQDVRGIGKDSALTLAHEIFGRGLQNRRQVGALTGLVPLPSNSGQTKRDSGISRAGNRRIRGLAVELAWKWLMWQPDSHLARWYQDRWADGGPRARRIGIVALARKLLIALWRYGDGGAPPRGAALRATA